MIGEPTILVTPPDADDLHNQQPGALLGLSPIVLAGAGLALIVFYFFGVGHRRRRRMDPRELAFRTLAKRLGLTRWQVNQIRKQALAQGLSSPVGLLMSRRHLSRLLADA